LPSEIVEQMAERYREAYRRLTGEEVVDCAQFGFMNSKSGNRSHGVDQ